MNNHQLYDKYKRDPKAKAFYNSKAWQRCRELVLQMDNHLWQECIKDKKITAADMVHHIIELSDDRSKGLDEDNLVSLCNPCHNKEHPDRGSNKPKSRKNKKLRVVVAKANREYMRGGLLRMVKMSKKKQNEIIEQEIIRLLEIFEDLPDVKKNAAKTLIERIAFMKVTLEILEDDIKTRGPTYLFQNGSQRMKVENPSQKSYNTMITRFTAANEKLFNLLPKGKSEVVDEVDDFEDF